jgi:hypothetical protein
MLASMTYAMIARRCKQVETPSSEESQMRVMMFVRRDPAIEMRPEDRADMPNQVSAWVEEMAQRGIRLHGAVFEPPDLGRTVRLRDGKPHVTSGTVSDGTEQVTGYNLLECTDLDQAIDVASRHPIARFGSIELRRLAAM